MSKKKIIAIALAAIMILACIAGCGKGQSQDSSTGSKTEQTPSSSSSGYKFTEAGGPDLGGITLTIGIQPNPFIISYEDNEFTRKLEEECNVKIEFLNFLQKQKI